MENIDTIEIPESLEDLEKELNLFNKTLLSDSDGEDFDGDDSDVSTYSASGDLHVLRSDQKEDLPNENQNKVRVKSLLKGFTLFVSLTQNAKITCVHLF